MSKIRNLIVGAIALVGLSGAAAPQPGNTISVIAPYKHHGQWVFDDPARGLKQEAFVAGADDWIDKATVKIPNAERGFVLVFSGQPFPGHQFQMERRRSDGSGGTWYYSPQFKMEGWLCSALLRYFKEPPPRLYAQVKPRAG
jgi:hypothetical protein